jgi:hypothetical protein
LLFHGNGGVGLFFYHSEVFNDVVEKAFELYAAVAADDEVKDFGGVFSRSGIDNLQAGRSTECNILGEEVLFADSVDEEVKVLAGEVLYGVGGGETPEVDVGLSPADGSGLVCDNEVYVLILQGDDMDGLTLVFHDLGEMVEYVPVLLGVKLADNPDGMHFLDVIDTFLARSRFEVADNLFTSDVFNEF